MVRDATKERGEINVAEDFESRLDHAKDFSDVFEVVKDTTKRAIGGYRVGLMLILDDLPLQVGAYHQV